MNTVNTRAQPATSGTVRVVVADRGYGFIQPDRSSGTRLFFHLRDLVDEEPPTPGTRVQFVRSRDGRGRIKASAVQRLEQEVQL